MLNVGLDADYDVIWVYLENKNEARVDRRIYALATYFAPLSLMFLVPHNHVQHALISNAPT